VSVLDHGAVPDGATDATEAIQNALNAAAAADGGVVHMPSGRYLVAGALNVPTGVTLQGDWQGPHATYEGQGTLILATGGRGDEDGTPLVSLNRSSTLKGVTIFYPEQDPADIQPYPWTIRGNGTHGNVIDTTLINPFNAMDFGTIPGCEMHYIRNVYGQPLKTGIFIDGCTDIGRVENVHFNPNPWTRFPGLDWGGGRVQMLFDYLKENLTGFVIARTDWEYMSNCFVIFPKIGFHFIQTERGSGNALLTQCGSDIGPVAVKIDSVQGHAGVAFSNCQFMQTIEIGPGCQGPVKLSNCGFWPAGDYGKPQIIMNGPNTVSLANCHFSGWGPEAPCVQVLSGAALLNGCDFYDTGQDQVYIGPEAQAVSVVGCRLRGGTRITNEAPEADVQIGLNLTR
jgi:hypothetical protein